MAQRVLSRGCANDQAPMLRGSSCDHTISARCLRSTFELPLNPTLRRRVLLQHVANVGDREGAQGFKSNKGHVLHVLRLDMPTQREVVLARAQNHLSH